MRDGDIYRGEETYIARGGETADRELTLAERTSGYEIEVRFLGGLTEPQKEAFKLAARRWTKVITGDLPGMVVDGETIDDVLITAEGVPIDGPGGVLGQAGPTHLRPGSAGSAAFLPAKGRMAFDTADLATMQANGSLNHVITHEMGHVIGVGTIWARKGLVAGHGTSNPLFTGGHAMAAYGALKGTSPVKVPVENAGGPGSVNTHWRETVFGNELMSSVISYASGGNPLSRLTAASLRDLGYAVDLEAAEAYGLPSLLVLAEGGYLARREEEGIMLTIVPSILPEESMVPDVA